MAKNNNPFAIRKSPVELITAQALTLDDYMSSFLDDGDRLRCATIKTR